MQRGNCGPCDITPPKLAALAAQPLRHRLLYCAGMLHVHGLLTDGERERVHQRMLKLKAKEAARG